MKVGEAFNPWRGECGFYPPDLVWRIGPMLVLATKRKFSDCHKLLYTLLVRRAGRDGRCFPSIERDLGPNTGRSQRSIKMALDDLEAFGLISRRRRGRGKGGNGQTSEYSFLWDPIFEVQKPAEDSGVLKCKNGDFEVQTPAVMKCKNEHPPYREETRTSETRTTTTGTQVAQPDHRTPPPSPVPCDAPGESREQGWWTPEEFQEARSAIALHFCRGLDPDPAITARILGALHGAPDCRLWIGYLGRQISSRSIRGFGFYESHARDQWPALRAETEEQQRATLASQIDRDAETAKRCAELEAEEAQHPTRNPPPPVTALRTPVPIAGRCVECQGSGIRQAIGDTALWEWCECDAGVRRRAEAPGAVDAANAPVLKVRRQFNRPADPLALADMGLASRRPESSADHKGLRRIGDLIPPGLTAAAKA